MGKKVAQIVLLIAAAAAILMWLVANGPPAHADAGEYFGYLHDHGVNVGIMPQTRQLFMGQEACREIRAGMPPSQIGVGSLTWADIPGIVDAAQHTLCPDTLGR